MSDDSDRGNAMLTDGNRKFLESDGSGYHRQTRKDHRDAIKRRVKDTMLDFTLLFEEWDESEREEVFREVLNDEDLRAGLVSFFALIYLENQFETGMKTLLFRGANKAEGVIADSDLNLVNINFSVDPVGVAKYREAIEKFRMTRFSDLSNEETHAIIRLLRHSGTVSPDDLEEMRQEMIGRFDEIEEEYGEARLKRAKYTREKQLRHREGTDNK